MERPQGAKMIVRRGVVATALALALSCGAASFAFPGPAAAADVQTDLAAAAGRLEELGGQLADLQSQLAIATADSEELDAAADAKGEEVVAAQEELSARQADLSEDMRYNYKVGSSSILDFLLSSSSFEDFVNRTYYVEKILSDQAEKIDSVKSAADRLAQEQKELEGRQAEQQAKVDELMALVEEYQGTVDEAASVYNALDEQAKAELASEQAHNENIATAVEAAESASADAEDLKQADANREDTKEPDAPAGSGGGQDGGSATTPGDSGQVDSDPSYSDGPLTGTRTRDPYLDTVTWAGDTEYINALASRAASIGSSTSYFIAFDNELCRFIVFQRSGGGWQAVKLWNCNGAKNTYSGVWTVVHKKICNWADEYFGKGLNDWSTCYIESYSSDSYGYLRYVPGKGYEDCAAVHSTGETTTGWSNRGCAGLQWGSAKWVYDNIPIGTTLWEFRYSDVF